MSSLARRRFNVLAAASALLLIGIVGGVNLTGAFDGMLSFNSISGEPVRVGIDASVGRTEHEQMARDVTRASDSVRRVQIEQARHALIAAGIEGAGDLSHEEIERRIRAAQVRAFREFYGEGSPAARQLEGLIEIR